MASLEETPWERNDPWIYITKKLQKQKRNNYLQSCENLYEHANFLKLQLVEASPPDN